MTQAAVALTTKMRRSHQPFSDYLELTKPRLASLVLVTTAVGFWVGASSAVPVSRFFWLLLGMAFVIGGANALNQWVERVEDGLMERTKSRPLPAGRLSSVQAHYFGVGLIVCGTILLAFAVNMLSASLAVGAAMIYLCGYTPLKRVTSLCTLVGAIPGALPPMIGWAAARNTLGLEAWVLFALLFLWQLPHFLALAVLFQEDYARAGFQMLSVTEPDGGATARQTLLYGVALLPVSLLPALIGLRGTFYFYGALVLSLSFLVLVVRSATVRSRTTARQLFLGSIIYLPLLMMCLVIG